MLQSIAGLDRDRASAVLAAAAQHLLRNVDPELAQTEILNTTDPGLPDKVIDELQANIGLRAEETEEQRLGRLNDALSRAMSETVLAGVDLNIIRDRAGQKGTLPTSLYRIVFASAFQAQAPLFAVKKSYVEDTIRHADLVDHLKPQLDFPGGVYSVSIFVKTPRTQSKSQYTLWVKCNRIGAELQVEHVFYLFHDRFKLNMRVTPLDMLTQFLEQFGMPIIVGGQKIDVIINGSVKIPETGTLIVSNIDRTQQIYFTGAPEEEIGVLLMYGFDQSKYLAYLRQHGLDSKPVSPIMTHTHGHLWRP